LSNLLPELSAAATIMADDQNREDSLERELDYEDITIAAGESSKARRQKKKKGGEDKKKEDEDRKKKEEDDDDDDKQEKTKEAMFRAGENSRAKRRQK
jgi:hypothetical protein